ncbi:NAD(P)H-binding protein [Helicobacter saguini]|uniref:NAD(P)H-binding protein n=1 Tax=Helicobacter saguini TaxID=1548018 RepID=A0A6B0HLK1_9HELI|nr:NAD(P)H-binding protein [Helicobacter saguini]MWV63202.1 NAD(P)H-binding protein [Helicobacter saguini]MWV66128.1 NAD(P)H-binding protein [Helicobacter saguini]MWV68478.1 NAD(P)H-binding protein [Helicobacter saguini]MWV71968.1 NAD(P)H-binding protein [Helicobacter saguini]
MDYTIIRTQWFSSDNRIDYEITHKGEPFRNPSAYISRKSIAHLIMLLCFDSTFGKHESLGINKPLR